MSEIQKGDIVTYYWGFVPYREPKPEEVRHNRVGMVIANYGDGAVEIAPGFLHRPTYFKTDTIDVTNVKVIHRENMG